MTKEGRIIYWLNYEYGEGNDNVKIVKSALEKQIPKKPIEIGYPWCICPTCGGSVYLDNVQEHIQNQETSYCEHCGQALYWGDAE